MLYNIHPNTPVSFFYTHESSDADTETLKQHVIKVLPGQFPLLDNEIYSDFYAYGIRNFLIGYQKFSE